MKIQRACQNLNCKKINSWDYPNSVRIITRVERPCKFCGVINFWNAQPHKVQTIKLTDYALSTMLLITEVFNKKYSRDNTIQEAFGILLAELEEGFKEAGKKMGILDK